MAARALAVIVVVMASFITCCSAFHFKECTNTTHPLLRAFVNISSDPVHIPGDETVFAEIQVLRNISQHRYTMSLKVVKLLFGSIHFKIPCIGKLGDTGDVGSCDYDVCQELNNTWVNRHCPVTHIDGTPTNYHCTCPVSPATYSIKGKTYGIPVLNTALALLAAGDYEIHGEVTDTQNGDIVYCFDATVTTTTDSSPPLG